MGMTWNDLSEPWKACFEEAWDAYCSGAIPIGAALAGPDNRIVSRGRNRVHESSAPGRQTCANKLAHAEVNVLLQVDISYPITADHALYTTTEPCVLCFGAIVMAGVRKVVYAARDPLAGGTNLNDSANRFIRDRGIEVVEADRILAEVQRVIRTDYVLRSVPAERGAAMLADYEADYPIAVATGRLWYREGVLDEMRREGRPCAAVYDAIGRALNHFTNR